MRLAEDWLALWFVLFYLFVNVAENSCARVSLQPPLLIFVWVALILYVRIACHLRMYDTSACNQFRSCRVGMMLRELVSAIFFAPSVICQVRVVRF